MRETCEQCQMEISDAIDAGVAIDQPIHDHMSECDECKSFYTMWAGGEQSFELLASLPLIHPIEGAKVDTIMEAIQKEEQRAWRQQSRSWSPRILMAVAAAVVFGVGLTWQLMPPTGQSDPIKSTAHSGGVQVDPLVDSTLVAKVEPEKIFTIDAEKSGEFVNSMGVKVWRSASSDLGRLSRFFKRKAGEAKEQMIEGVS